MRELRQVSGDQIGALYSSSFGKESRLGVLNSYFIANITIT